MSTETTTIEEWADAMRVQLAKDLRSIEDMYDNLQTEAVNRGGDPNMPGGMAMVMLGPGADVEAFGYAQLSAMMGRVDPGSVETDDIEPPLSFLSGWVDIVREERDQPTGLKATVGREVAYLRRSVDWMLSSDEYGDLRFIQVDDFAEQLEKVRRALENVLRDGHRATRIRAECKSCEDSPRLCLRQGAAKDGSQDHWYCPACYHAYDVAGVSRCWRQMFVKRGDAPEWVPLRAAASSVGRPVSTVRTWTLPPDRGDGEPKRFADGSPMSPLVESEMRDDGLRWVRWADVRAADDTTRRRGFSRLVA